MTRPFPMFHSSPRPRPKATLTEILAFSGRYEDRRKH
jgi:hypothetical protein